MGKFSHLRAEAQAVSAASLRTSVVANGIDDLVDDARSFKPAMERLRLRLDMLNEAVEALEAAMVGKT